VQALSGADVVLPYVGHLAGWQAGFLVVGLPGIAVSALMLTVREPVRQERRAATAPAPTAIPLREVLAYVRQNGGTFAGLFGALSMISVTGGAGSALQSLPRLPA
jgi:hypothetical protein